MNATEPRARATVVVNLPGGGLVPQVQEALGGHEFVVAIDDERARDAEILLMLSRERATLDPATVPQVRWIHAFATGVDSYPLDAIGDRAFTCSRGANAIAIAEFVLASMLAFAKRFPESWLTEPPEHWNVAQLDVLSGKTVGLVGVGAIGTEVARRALAFDMRVVGYRRRAIRPEFDEIELCAGLEDLLGQSDHVVIAAPATPATYHMIDAQALAAIKPAAHLVNIARGSLVDQDALLAALDDGRVACASLDTVDPEPLPAGHAFYAHPNVRLSAHVSWSAPDSLGPTLRLFAENVRRYRAGEPLHGLVDVDAGY
ncbi:MAG TPA: NAD(P)-dependent oxidoreductase [Acidimicrobiia bacterium]|nr:NAD(P)-dependent oxidoreductase [Acidimicrobiia bacterium]